MPRLLLAFITSLFFFPSIAQDFSNKGKEFWIPYSYHVAMASGSGAGLSMTLYITSDVTTNFSVEIFGGANIQTGTVTAGNVVMVNVPNTNFINGGGAFTGKTVRVTAEKPVVVYSYITSNAVSGATVCLPTNVLGKEYVSMNYTQVSNENRSNSYFTVIAVEDNTTVEIIPAATTTNGWAAGSVNTVTMNKGEIYQILGTVSSTASGGLWTGGDLTGSKIRSIASTTGGCKRIAVFSGAGKIRIGANCGNASSSDNLYQQLYPVASWGKNFLTVPSFSRPNNFFRIIKSTAATNIYLNGTLIPAASFVNNQYYEFSGNIPNAITSDEPITVAQYFTTAGCSSNPNPHDPDMIILNPVEQNISNVTLVSSNLVATANRQHHIHVIIPNGGTGISTFKLDGAIQPASIWTVHPGNPAYSYAYLSNVSQGYHTLSSDSGFNALAYGYANAESYGYSAGANVKDLYQYVSIETPNATVKFPTTCNNTPFFFAMTFPYKPTKISWVFGTVLNNQGIADISINAPVPNDSSVVNGKTLYLFKLPSQYKIPIVGLYPIKVIANNPTSDGCGGEQEVNYDFDVIPAPKADFKFNDVCKGLPMQFTDTSKTAGRAINKVFWNFGDNNNGTTPNPSHTYADSGNYNASYWLITDIGCISDTVVKTVRSKPLPTAAIIGTDTVCLNVAPPQITFTGDYGAAPFTFTYNINGGAAQTVTTTSGNTVTVAAPTGTRGVFTYNLLGVKEGSANACTQAQTGSSTITIFPTPTAAISGTTAVCLNTPAPQILFTGAEGDAPYTFTYTINGGANLQVTTSTGNTASVAVPTTTAGVFTYALVSVSDANGTLCIQPASGSASVTVNDLPTATISGTASLCQNASEPQITFTGANTTAPYTFTYNVNGGAVQSVTTTSGNSVTVNVPTNLAGSFTYNLLSVTDGSATTCSQAQSGDATVIVWPLPVANYATNSPVCATGTINFTDRSVPNVGTTQSWLWDFNDPSSGAQNSSTLPDPSHVFASPGTYNIKLTVTTSNGCVSINSLTPLVINPRPKAGFVLPEVCLNDTYAQFNDSSKVAAPGSLQTWLWNFGDPNWNTPPVSPNTATIKNPQHSYKDVGNYPVSLIVTSNHGCRDTVQQTLTVNGSFPVARFTVSNPATLCANDSVSITDASTVFPGVITKVEIWWDNLGSPSVKFTDDDPKAGETYRHLYPNFQSPLTKTYQIRFRAFSGGVCTNDRTETITLNAAPKVRFTAMPNICFDAPAYQITEATEIGAVPGSGVFSGPGVSASGIFNPAAAGTGVHTIKYRFTSTTGGCADSITQTIKVWERALADFSVTTTPTCEKQAVTFTDRSTSAEGAITQWRWDFGDGTPLILRSNATPFTHTFVAYGTYSVSLTVVTANGCVSASKTTIVNIEPLARPAFSFPPVSCLPNAVIPFTNLSTVPNALPSSLTYLWDFGDPGSGPVNSSTQQDPAHTYANLGPFNVKLQATTSAGCVHDTTIILNTLHPQPIASFSTSTVDVCLGGAIQFTNTSDPADGTLQTLHWDLKDGTTPGTQSFAHTYTMTGIYDVTLYIMNSFNCKSTVFTKPVSVNPIPVADAGPDRVMLDGGQLTINANATNANGLTYAWTPATALNDPSLLRPTASPASDTRYLLTVTSDKGCVDTSSMFLKVLYKPIIPNTFTPNGDGYNDKWEIQYIESYPGALIEVYNTTGQLIFRSIGYNNPWDGTMNGKQLPVGTYYYVVDPKNGRSKIPGYVTIIR